MKLKQIVLLWWLVFSSALAANYTVQAKDTLYSIAKKFNTSVVELQKLNNLSTTAVSIGQVLVVPDPNRVHVVAVKETLFSIAKKYGVSMKEILELNKLTSSDLKIGQRLLIPNAASGTISTSNSNSSAKPESNTVTKPSSSNSPKPPASSGPNPPASSGPNPPASSSPKPSSSSSPKPPKSSSDQILTGNPNNPVKPPSTDPFDESGIQPKPLMANQAAPKPPVVVVKPIDFNKPATAPSNPTNPATSGTANSGMPTSSNTVKPPAVTPNSSQNSSTANTSNSSATNSAIKPPVTSGISPKPPTQNPSSQPSSTSPTSSSSLPPRPTIASMPKPPINGSVKPATSSANANSVLPTGRGSDAPVSVAMLSNAPLPNLSAPPIVPASPTRPDQVDATNLPSVSTPVSDVPEVPELIHTVALGETLYRIALKYNVSIESIRAANNLSSDAITVGQQLKIPVSSTPSTSNPAPGSSSANNVREVANRYLGVLYRYGGTNSAGLDCSGFVQIVFAELGIKLPRTSALQFQVGVSIERENLQEGDLVFFNTTGNGVSHVGIYLSDDQFIHAASNPGKVTISSLSEKYWQPKYLGARRVLNND